MLITPRTGVNGQNLLCLLRSVQCRVFNLRSGGPSLFIEYPDRLEVVDLNALGLDIQGTRVHVLAPIVVVDELDRLKKAGPTKQARDRDGQATVRGH